jgi:hypothetical protein
MLVGFFKYIYAYFIFHSLIVNIYFLKLLKEYAESERLEQLTTEKRRLKILEYRQTVNDMLEERRQRRTEELQYLMGLHDLEVEEEKARYQTMVYLSESRMTSCFLYIYIIYIRSLNVRQNLLIEQWVLILCI